jgi:HAD superfamily hydrolase (TIGR01458 family)
MEDLAGIDVDESAAADTVLLGDLGDTLTFDRLNRAFRTVVSGAELVTLARNRYWRSKDGLVLDVGAFAAALEYSSGKPATLVGKPSPRFFEEVLAAMGIPAGEAAVVGDDVESDVAGGQNAGMRGILVRTGKFRGEDPHRSSVRPDAILDSIADLPSVF